MAAETTTNHDKNAHLPITGADVRFFLLNLPDSPPEPFHFALSVCTVDLLTPKCPAAALTVALFSMMYSASSTARLSMLDFKCTTPNQYTAKVYGRSTGDM